MASLLGHDLNGFDITPIGSLALIVLPITSQTQYRSTPISDATCSSDVVVPLWLDDLTDQTMAHMGGSYLEAYAGLHDHPDDNNAQGIWKDILDGTLYELWNKLMGSLVETLIRCGVRHCILIPQGLLRILPLHAAWRKDATLPSGRFYALDALTFSYSPNARALGVARKNLAMQAAMGESTLLAVEVPETSLLLNVGTLRLKYAAFEVESACSYFTNNTVLRGEEVTRDALLKALSNYPPASIWHFSCHGRADVAEPLNSGLFLTNGEMLSLHDMLTQRISAARLAVLSSCEMGLVGLKLPYEVLSLQTGLVQVGVSGIVAPLSSVGANSTLLILRFYDLWCDEELSPAEALRQAQIWMRDTTNSEKKDYVKSLMPKLVENSDAFHDSKQLYSYLMRLHLEAHSFVHPFHWAAFSFTGI